MWFTGLCALAAAGGYRVDGWWGALAALGLVWFVLGLIADIGDVL